MKQLFTLLSFLILSNSFGQNALNFDGTNDFVQTSFEGVFGTANRTFEAWIFVSVDAPASNLAITDYGLNATGSRNTFMVNGTRGLTYISGGVDANIGTGPDVIPEGVWTHVAFVLNSGTGFLYVNGVEEATGVLTTVDTPEGHSDLRIGQRVSGGSILFNGNIDEVRIWDVARTVDEINETMNTELCSAAGLVAYYQLNEGEAGGVNTGLIDAPDEIDGNNGVLNNFALTGATSNWVTGVDLEVLPTYEISSSITECSGFSITVGDNTYTETGVYTDEFETILGCDSTIITDLTILPYGLNELDLNECTGYSITLNAVTYNETGFYTDTLAGEAANGCDSIIVLDLTIHEEAINDLVITECMGYSIVVNGTEYNTTGSYAETVTGGGLGGCDSIINLDLTILPNAVNELIIDACVGYEIEVNGTLYNSTGEYTETIAGGAANGCDSIINLDLTVADPVDVTTTTDILTITANEASATYQWINCETMTTIPGETDQSYTVTENGNYAVIVTIGDCADTSACISFADVGLSELAQESKFSIYPNPANDNITIQTEQSGTYAVSIYTLLGEKCIEQTEFQNNTALKIQDLPAGTYLVQIQQDGNKVERLFFIKK